MDFYIDRLNRDFVEGWAVAPEGIDRIEVWVDGASVGTIQPHLLREDVATARPDLPSEFTSRSGFLFAFQDHHFQDGQGSVEVRIVPRVGLPMQAEPVLVANIERHALDEAFSQCQKPGENRAPFPNDVLALLCAFRGTKYSSTTWTDELVEEALGDLEFLVRRGSRRLPGIYPYLAYVKGLWAKFVLVRDCFPRIANQQAGAKDFIATTTTIEEMITIAHHLYLLRKNGLPGKLAEFGCFKGFSTALLSHACFELGIQMDVFDSFAGLPPSESSYYSAGEFSGRLDEVRQNVTQFGRMDCVEFHPGFFSKTLIDLKPVMSPVCIWMDVDLASSSRDVMSILERLPYQSCLFSHECREHHFDKGQIFPTGGTDDVIKPIVEAFSRCGRNITGRYLSGHTGAFWDPRMGWPVLPTNAVLRLIEMH